jgi:prepilin-type N-terminal cleavage/methylation domain-containing protein
MLTSTAAKKSRSRERQSGFSLIELLIVVAIILIIAAIAIPNMLASRKAANQASAVASLRTISSATVSYSTTYGNGLPASLDVMGGPTGGIATCNLSLLLDPTLSSAPYQKNGYQISYSGQEGNITDLPPGCAAPGFNGYLSVAVPIEQGFTGNASYCNTEDGVLHTDVNGGAIASQAACAALQSVN